MDFELSAEQTMLVAEREALTRDTVSVPILREQPAAERRATRRLNRGSYLNPLEEVSPGIPVFLAGVAPGEVGNRLDLARWMVSDAKTVMIEATPIPLSAPSVVPFAFTQSPSTNMSMP